MTGRPRLLIVTAVEAERAAVRRGVAPADGSASAAQPDDGAIVVVAAGVGVAAAAAGTARRLAHAEWVRRRPFAGVISVGIGGAFDGRAAPGQTVLATRSVAADLGTESPDGFMSMESLGFGSAAVEADAWLLAALRTDLPGAATGEILTVTTATGTDSRAVALAQRHPDAVGEAMEGYGVAAAASQAGVPFAELRTVSNLIGVRDRESWEIGPALEALSRAGAVLASLGG